MYIVPHNSYLWKIKIPLKIKVFLWLLYREAILTKDNLVKRSWHGNEMCSFCNNSETIQHLFFDRNNDNGDLHQACVTVY
jgi:hypothetical protein